MPADRFHGWVKEIDQELSRMAEDGIDLEGREISLLHVKMCDSEIEMSIMGRKLKLKRLSPEEMAGIIATKEALEKIGHGSLINVKALCEYMGISHKATYRYYHREEANKAKERQRLKELTVQGGIRVTHPAIRGPPGPPVG